MSVGNANRILLKHLVVLLSAGLVAILTTSIASQSRYTPATDAPAFQSIAADAWIVDGSAVRLPLQPIPMLSVVQLQFDAWRPHNAEPAHITMQWCGEREREFLLLPEAQVQRIRLPLSCLGQHPEIRFRVGNPVREAGEGSRGLGARLTSVSLHSPLGFALVFDGSALVFALLVICVWFVSQYQMESSSGGLRSWFAYLIVAAVCIATSNSETRIESLFLSALLGCIVLGYRFAPKLVAVSSPRVRERSENERVYRMWAIAICLLAATLRFYGITFGLPETYHPDELTKANVLAAMARQDSLNPGYFLHPSLLLYASYALSHFVVAPLSNYSEVADYIISGRIVSALSGTLAVLILMRIAQMLFSNAIALLAGAILAVAPLAVTCSRYFKEDSLVLCLLLLTVLVSVRAAQGKLLRWVLLAAFCAGLTTSAKYSGLISICSVCAIPWLSTQAFRPNFRLLGYVLLAILIAVPLGFLIGTPYAALDWVQFLEGVSYERTHMQVGHAYAIDPWSQFWMYHLRRSLFPGFQGIFVTLGAFAIGVVLAKRSVPWLFVVGMLAAMYVPAEWVKAKPAPQAERYVLGCLPFLALLAAGIITSAPKVKHRYSLAALGIVPMLVLSLLLAWEVPRDTRARMAQEIKTQIPKGATIVVDGGYYLPELDGDDFQILSQHLPSKPWLYRRERLAQQGVDYILISSLGYKRYFSQPNAPKEIRSLYRHLLREYPTALEVRPLIKTYGFHNPTLQLLKVSPLRGDSARAQLASPTKSRQDSQN